MRIEEQIRSNPDRTYYVAYMDTNNFKLVNDMNEISRTSTILKNVFNMMTELGLVPLTEGIETEEQYKLLSQMGCKLFQGYPFAKPLPVEEFEEKYLK